MNENLSKILNIFFKFREAFVKVSFEDGFVVMRFHVNPDSGDVNVCRAQKKCRFGDDAPHFSNERDAEAFYEESQSGSFKPVKKMKVYRVGTLEAPETYFEDLEKVLQDIDKFKPEERQGRFKGIFASPDFDSHSRWVLGNSYNKHDGALDSHEITVDANSVYVYSVNDYEKASSIQGIYGSDSEKFEEAAKNFWNGGITLSDWKVWAEENKPEAGSWEIIMSPEAMISTKKLSNREVIENAPDGMASSLNSLLELKRYQEGLIWRKSKLSVDDKFRVREAALQKFDETFVNQMETVYNKNAYRVSDLCSGLKHIYSSFQRVSKKQDVTLPAFSSLSKQEQREFSDKVESYLTIIETLDEV